MDIKLNKGLGIFSEQLIAIDENGDPILVERVGVMLEARPYGYGLIAIK
jgi:hypothetical protein